MQQKIAAQMVSNYPITIKNKYYLPGALCAEERQGLALGLGTWIPFGPCHLFREMRTTMLVSLARIASHVHS